MAINFDALPKNKPEGGGGFELIPEGRHKVTIESASVKSGPNSEYIEAVYKVEGYGKHWDRLFISDKAAPQYKLARFLRACGIPLVGEMELTDLCTVVVGKTFYTDFIHKTEEYKGEERTRAEVDIFGGDIYYLPHEIENQTQVSENTTNTTGQY